MSDKVYWRDVYDAAEKRISELEKQLSKWVSEFGNKTLEIDEKLGVFDKIDILQTEIAELREHQRSTDILIREYEQAHNFQLNELKEQIECVFLATEELNAKHLNNKAELNELKESLRGTRIKLHNRIQRYEEVLREFFEKMLHYSQIADFPSDQAYTNLNFFYKQQLEKLEGKTELNVSMKVNNNIPNPPMKHFEVILEKETEKKEYIKKDIKDFKSDEPITFVNPKFDVPEQLKASGGVKSDGVEETPSKSSTNLANQTNLARQTDSKLAEPTWGFNIEPREDEPKSKHNWNHLTEVSYCDICNQFAHHVGYGSECIIDEPREDEPITWQEVKEYLRKFLPSWKLVKREKIEFWRTEMLNKTHEVLKSMREVLGIE